MASLPYPRSHKTIFPQNSRNTQKRLAEKKNLCTSVKSVGEYPPPEASVKICAICGRLLSARRFCGFCVFRGMFLSEAMLVQRRPLHPLKIATLQQQDCHATTTRLPCYNNKIATLQQQGCHATTTRLPRYGKMSRDGCKMNWKIGWKIAPIVQVSSSHYFTDTQHVVRRMEDMVDIFAYSILFIAL